MDAREALREYAERNSHSAPRFRRALEAVLDACDAWAEHHPRNGVAKDIRRVITTELTKEPK